jgi:hypothetical protein
MVNEIDELVGRRIRYDEAASQSAPGLLVTQRVNRILTRGAQSGIERAD